MTSQRNLVAELRALAARGATITEAAKAAGVKYYQVYNLARANTIHFRPGKSGRCGPKDPAIRDVYDAAAPLPSTDDMTPEQLRAHYSGCKRALSRWC